LTPARKGLPFAPPATPRYPLFGRAFCAVASEISLSSKAAANTIRLDLIIAPLPSSCPFLPDHRFPPPWSVENKEVALVVADSADQKLAYVYFEDDFDEEDDDLRTIALQAMTAI
jgi:hypothetical protein